MVAETPSAVTVGEFATMFEVVARAHPAQSSPKRVPGKLPSFWNFSLGPFLPSSCEVGCGWAMPLPYLVGLKRKN
jgi:hypothetical protein